MTIPEEPSRKKKGEMEDPMQGEEMNTPLQKDVTNSRPRRDKNLPDHDFLGATPSGSLLAFSSQVCAFIFNKSLSLSCNKSALAPENA